MDSYHFHFERMSNLDLHPLSLPVSRLSPAKSSSSIDQYTHHHSKGDSAYSSFSGGSTVPDYPSPFLLDELQSHSPHYTDLKHAKAKYSPTFLDSDLKSMDQLYRSMETNEQQHHQNNNGSSNIESSLVPTHPLPPPPPPARLDSFVTTRNLENSRARQSPEGQLADISTTRHTVNPEFYGIKTEPVCGRVFSQHCQRDQLKQDLVMIEPPKSTGILNQSEQNQYLSNHSEIQRKRSHSAYVAPASEQQCYINSWHTPQNMFSGSVQHKGQFYFVTGVVKSPESSNSQFQSIGDNTSIEEWPSNGQLRRQSCPSGPSGRLFFQEEHNPSCKLEHNSQGVEDQIVLNKENGKNHSSNHPIFYCGPEENSAGKVMTPAQIKEEQSNHPTKDPSPRNLKHTLLDVPSEKISKETTPLLYHLTGANRAAFANKFQNNNDCGMDREKDKQKDGKDGQISPSSDCQKIELSNQEQPTDFSYQCGTLDDSYKKYYKEKLKDAQSKVLRETSFKRRDLQLSWPHRIKQTEKRLSVIPTCPPSQNIQPNMENATPQLHKPQGMDKDNMKDFGHDIEKGIQKQQERTQNIAQPQVPRVGGRKRLTADQKKLSHSEPEKLHQLADEPAHVSCRSLGNESEVLLSDEGFGDPGLVASRRKMFETRGRTLSASSLSKSTLKHIQHKALVAYMERKTGHKVAEPQQPVPQVPNHRNSAAGRPFDWCSRHNSGNKKPHRPLSAGRILDSLSSSAKYSQFITAQPNSHSRQSSWREESPIAGKSASAETLLDQLEQPEFFRARSTSSPHSFQIQKRPKESLPIHNKEMSSGERNMEGETVVRLSSSISVPDEPWTRLMASRGKSMEELGFLKVTRPEGLSKSSEQLDQLQVKQAVSGKEKRIVSFLAAGQERTERKLYNSEEHSDNSQAGPEKQHSKHPSSASDSTASGSYSRLRAFSSPPDSYESHGLASANRVSSHEDEIHFAPHINGSKNRDSTVSMLNHTTEPSGIKLEASKEQEVSAQDVLESSASGEEVSLSHGVTTDPSLWISTPEMNEAESNNWSSSETPTNVQPQIAPPTPSESETVTTAPDVQEQTPAPYMEPNGNEKREDEAPVIENKGSAGNNPQDNLQWEVLVQEVVSADQSLARTLYPITNRKTALMLMEQLLSEDTLLMEEHYKKKQEQNNKQEAANSMEVAALSNNQNDTQCNTETHIIGKKKQLIVHIEERLKPLEEARSVLQKEEKENGERGDALETLVQESCVPAELERYRQFIGDLERVVSLLLCLSARLARVQNALTTVDENTDTEEKQSLDNRHRLLCKQREDAKDLKDNLDKRERVVSAFLSKQLTDAQLQEYRRFIQTKASLLIQQKDLDEKQRLGEEQLEALLNTMPR